jgi:membrane-bound lytic murein transglycosylase D
MDQPVRKQPCQLLEGLPESDLARMQAEAMRHFLKHWPIVSERSRYVRSRMLNVFASYGAPESLQVLPIVESGYNPYAFSSAGATGLWQLMPGTARFLKVKGANGINGRRDVEASTSGALRYLLSLRQRFGNWPLALAAYHRGPGSIARALRRRPWQPADGIRHLPVPGVTRAYVRHVLGLAAMFHRGALAFPEPYSMRSLVLQGPLDLTLLTRASRFPPQELYRFNPGLEHSQYLDTSITLFLPDDAFDTVSAYSDRAAPEYISVRVRKGDSLWSLARKYGTSVAFLKRINPGVGRVLQPGQILQVPASRFDGAAPRPNPLLVQGRRIRYRVRNGDNLWNIAKKFGTTPRAIARANSLKDASMLRPGDTLWIHARIRPS